MEPGDSVDVTWTTSLVTSGFQLASTDRTDTLKTLPAVCANGVPVLPVVLPGTAVSPESRTCNLVNGVGFTVTSGLVFGVLVASSASDAVTVQLPAVRNATLMVRVPAARSALGGSIAFGSEEAI